MRLVCPPIMLLIKKCPPLLSFVATQNHDDFSQKQLLSIPITRLPATLGRSHDTKDTNFFGLGTRKVLSRSQAVIFWGDRFGGRLVQSGTSDQLVYQPPPTTKGAEKKYDVIRLNKDDPLPEMGYVNAWIVRNVCPMYI